jgi:hypothetical protein
MPKFSDALLSQNFVHLGRIFDRLVAQSPDVALQVLDGSVVQSETSLRLDLAPFHKAPKSPPDPESRSVFRMLRAGADFTKINFCQKSF